MKCTFAIETRRHQSNKPVKNWISIWRLDFTKLFIGAIRKCNDKLFRGKYREITVKLNNTSHYSIHVAGWLLKWLKLITGHGSLNNKPGSVRWLATKYLKTISWRNHNEKLTTLWPQNISFWPEINIPFSYFTIWMLNCLENTLKLQFDSCVTAVKFLT